MRSQFGFSLKRYRGDGSGAWFSTVNQNEPWHVFTCVAIWPSIDRYHVLSIPFPFSYLFFSQCRSCFASVPTSPYLETCLVGKTCAAETAYIHTCHRHYHELSQNISSYCRMFSLMSNLLFLNMTINISWSTSCCHKTLIITTLRKRFSFQKCLSLSCSN